MVVLAKGSGDLRIAKVVGFQEAGDKVDEVKMLATFDDMMATNQDQINTAIKGFEELIGKKGCSDCSVYVEDPLARLRTIHFRSNAGPEALGRLEREFRDRVLSPLNQTMKKTVTVVKELPPNSVGLGQVGKGNLIASGTIASIFETKNPNIVYREAKVSGASEDAFRQSMSRYDELWAAAASKDPTLTPQVFQKVVNDEGRVVGHLIEKIPGKPLSNMKLSELTNDQLEQLEAQIVRIVDRLDAVGQYHGDLKDANLLVSSAQDGALVVRMIDPGLMLGTQKQNIRKDMSDARGMFFWEKDRRGLIK